MKILKIYIYRIVHWGAGLKSCVGDDQSSDILWSKILLIKLKILEEKINDQLIS